MERSRFRTVESTGGFKLLLPLEEADRALQFLEIDVLAL